MDLTSLRGLTSPSSWRYVPPWGPIAVEQMALEDSIATVSKTWVMAPFVSLRICSPTFGER